MSKKMIRWKKMWEELIDALRDEPAYSFCSGCEIVVEGTVKWLGSSCDNCISLKNYRDQRKFYTADEVRDLICGIHYRNTGEQIWLNGDHCM